MIASRAGENVSRVFMVAIGLIACFVAAIAISYAVGFEAWLYEKGGFWSAFSSVAFVVMTLVLFLTRGKWRRARREADMPLLVWAFTGVWFLRSLIL